MIDDQKLHQFIGQMLSDLGGAASIALVRIGDSLGLYKTLHARGAMTAAELAAEAAVNERYLREWLKLPLLRSNDREIRVAAGTGHGFRYRG